MIIENKYVLIKLSPNILNNNKTSTIKKFVIGPAKAIIAFFTFNRLPFLILLLYSAFSILN